MVWIRVRCYIRLILTGLNVIQRWLEEKETKPRGCPMKTGRDGLKGVSLKKWTRKIKGLSG